MNHDLSLTLGLLEQTADCLRFRLAIRNCSKAKVLVPYPEIHGLRFANKATMQESKWRTRLLVSGDWRGFTLVPAEEKAIEYRVRPCDARCPEDNYSDYYRWCVELPPADYVVWFPFEVGEDYFCPDSHYRHVDLLREAESAQAALWTGRTTSNRSTFSHPLPPTTPPIDALKRLIQIETRTPVPQWSRDEFFRAAKDGKKRWQEIEDLFGITYGIFKDALSQIAPSFQLTPPEQSLADTVCVWRTSYAIARIAVWFLKWERCPETSGLPNPYEPWIEIWEHGGFFRLDHGQFVEVFDHEKTLVGSVMVRRA